MKPLKLVMEGFGSYIKRTEIDFTAFGDNALFLITGSTGGGKTTILDAICFALYGKATGGLRSWEQMRSIGADDSIPTCVDFTFSLGQKKYRFFRSQTIYTGRRDGERKTRVENACYDLSYGEKLLKSGADRGVTLQAQSLLGLDCDQFSRVMILPQGEFRRLLLSPSSEKAKLFEKLFDSQQWSRITDCATEKAKAVEEEAQILVANRQALLSSCGCETSCELEEKSALAAERYTKAKKTAEKLDAQFKLKQVQSQKLKRLDELKAAAEKSRIALNRANEEQKTAIELFAAAEKNSEAIIPLREEINLEREKALKLDESLKKLSQITLAKKELKQCEESLDKAQMQKETLEQQAKEIIGKTAIGEEYITTVRREIESIPNEIIKLQTLNEISENYKLLENIKQKLEDAEKEAEISVNAYNSVMLELELLRESEKAVEEKLQGNMAVYLSSQLESGKPCPVCGSSSHPHPAKPIGEDEQGLARKKKELAHLIKEKEQLCSQRLRFKSEKAALCDQLKQQLNEQQSKCDSYNIYYKTCKHDLDMQKSRLYELNAKKAKLPTAERKLAALKAQLEQNNKSSAALAQEILCLETQKAQSQERISTLSQYLGNQIEGESKLKSSLNAARQKINLLEKQVQEIQKTHSAAKSRLEVAAALISERKQQLDEYEKQRLEAEEQCAEFEIKDYEKTAEECNELERRLKLMLGESGEAKRESESLKSSLEQIQKQFEKSREVEKLYSNLCHLADILRGSNPMKVPIKMFVLGMMLEDILLQANKYFVILSDGRYKLEKVTQEQGGNSLRGLDIEVFDGSYGGTRPVHTLSGGEMFLASLSLAFGLSDVVQGYSGGIRLDSIFIDEGFGSLDSETLDTAMKALDRINRMGRTVGIISHVSQLSEKIGNKIIVSSDNTGSHIGVAVQ
ncbi:MULTISPECIES: AAA family ATPase [unclassified Ruminococcus]|uniref:AAA family ATPase n=1 Tax=unclassified Ruminococcus TaxID=2608920 RepID=UPI00210C8AAD|nr:MULTISPECIES: SMC family ATPase [unclassified Ruminococcus]MCQ4021856.1 hypothetical protein [Ruminococcus sp. zg-924]MCQ4114301.1 hypothetical protein [Ruminococcus sp. zg-921]